MVTVNACFDESGKLADTAHVAFAGCVATESDWRGISRRWNEILGTKGLKSTSMKDAIHFHKSFEGWQDRVQERDDLLVSLAKMLQRDVGFHGACPINCAQFKALPDKHKKKLKNPQYCGFEATVTLALDWLRPDMKLHVFCDSSDEYAKECIGLYNLLRNNNRVAKEKCIAITFAEDEHFPPLQAADMLAYCVRADASRDVVAPDPIVDRLLRIFTGDGNGIYGFAYDSAGAGLGHGIRENPDGAPYGMMKP
jgi:hypothetical protein